MNYPLEIFTKCKEIVETSNKYNLATNAKHLKNEVYAATNSFPESISFSMRIRAIASDSLCNCKQCGKIHGDPEKEFCSSKCYHSSTIVSVCKYCGKSYEKKSSDCCSEMCSRMYRESGYKSMKDAYPGDEGIDYITCQECGHRLKELAGHYKRYHPAVELPVRTKCGVLCARMLGAKNPSYQHGGKFSVHSKNFMHGYNEERSKKIQKDNGIKRTNNPTNVFSRAAYDSGEAYLKAQTRDISYFIEKYGEEEGKHRHSEKTRKWLETMDLKSDEELNDINTRKVKKSGTFFSKSEMELVEILSGKFAVFWQKCLNIGKKRYLYDICVDNKIIEYNGDFWHASFAFFGAGHICPYSKKTAEQIWERDYNKYRCAYENGYEVLYIWEHDYKQDPQREVQRCINFLTQ